MEDVHIYVSDEVAKAAEAVGVSVSSLIEDVKNDLREGGEQVEVRTYPHFTVEYTVVEILDQIAITIH